MEYGIPTGTRAAAGASGKARGGGGRRPTRRAPAVEALERRRMLTATGVTGPQAPAGHVTASSNAAIVQVAVTSGPARPVAGAVTLTATLTVTPGGPDPGSLAGLVTFVADGMTLGSAQVTTTGGVSSATFRASTLKPGTHTVIAIYGPYGGGQSNISPAATVTVVPPVVNDYDGDGTADLAVFRPATDQWFVQGSAGVNLVTQFGDPAHGDVPVPGNYEGNGKTDLAVFRPATGQWLIQLSDGTVRVDQFGDPAHGDVPVPADYEGNGKADLAVFRPATGQWLVRLSDGTVRVDQFGDPAHGDVPVPADYEGNGKADLAVFRPATDLWIVRHADGTVQTVQFGDPSHGDIPAPGDYEGNGKTDFAVFRPASARWIINTATGGTIYTPFGVAASGDLAASAPLASLGLITIPKPPPVAPSFFEAIATVPGKKRQDAWLAALDDLASAD